MYCIKEKRGKKRDGGWERNPEKEGEGERRNMHGVEIHP